MLVSPQLQGMNNKSTNYLSGSNEGDQNQTSTTVVTKPLTLDQDNSQSLSPDMADPDDF